MPDLRIQQAMDHAVAEKVFPGAILMAAKGETRPRVWTAGRVTYDAVSSPVDAETLFDLASLTKVLCTTYLVMIFIDQNMFTLGSTLDRLWPGPVPADKAGLSLERLLAHTSGLPPGSPTIWIWKHVRRPCAGPVWPN